jgi:hypothetical protein
MDERRIAIYVGDLPLSIKVELYNKLVNTLGLTTNSFGKKGFSNALWFSIANNALQKWTIYRTEEEEIEDSVKSYEDAGYTLISFYDFLRQQGYA